MVPSPVLPAVTSAGHESGGPTGPARQDL